MAEVDKRCADMGESPETVLGLHRTISVHVHFPDDSWSLHLEIIEIIGPLANKQTCTAV